MQEGYSADVRMGIDTIPNPKTIWHGDDMGQRWMLDKTSQFVRDPLAQYQHRLARELYAQPLVYVTLVIEEIKDA